MLAPVGISVYTRLEHFQSAISALQKNPLAVKTNLVVYSDAASKQEDVKLVSEVRQFAKHIIGFRTVTLIERSTNYGGVKNAHQAVLQLVRVFKKAIFIEDDIETAPGFLTFMNSALDFYKDNPSVVSISGYSPPLNINDYVHKDFFVMNRFCGWGCGLYERTTEWLQKKISQQEFDELEDKSVLAEFGDDVLAMVKREVAGELDAADVRCMFRQAVYGKATIYPRFSLVQNIGHDGSGVHCGISNRFRHKQLWSKSEHFVFDDDIVVDHKVKQEMQDFRAFKGKYKKSKTIFNMKQSKEVTNALLSEHFDKAFDDLLMSQSSDEVIKKNSLVIISTPRVGSTWLCEILTPSFGDSIANEWLHRRFVEKYLTVHDSSTALDYLTLLKYHAFSGAKVLALHIHANQHRYWKVEHGIDLLDFFSFSHVFYMQRKGVFDQIFSFAVASETGLWRDTLVEKANISEKFILSLSQSKFEQAERALLSEFEYFDKYLENRVNTFFDYESLLAEPTQYIAQLFSGMPVAIGQQIESVHGNKKIAKPFIDLDAKKKLAIYYSEREPRFLYK